MHKGYDNIKGYQLENRTPEERREIARKGAEATHKKRAEKKMLRMCLEELLARDMTDRKGNTVSGAEALSLTLFKKAMDGDVRAFEVIRDTAGQKPAEKVVVSEIDKDLMDEVENIVAAARYEGSVLDAPIEKKDDVE